MDNLSDKVSLEINLTEENLDISFNILNNLATLFYKYDWNFEESNFYQKIRKIIGLCKKIENKNYKKRSKEDKKDKKEEDRSKINQTGIRISRNEKVRKYDQFYNNNLERPLKRQKKESEEIDSNNLESIELKKITIKCYICKKVIKSLHHFYDQMCFSCGDFNFIKRSQTADLKGKIALVTGGRVKIGFETGLILLKSGALVIVTTRFPNDCLKRYQKEKDYDEWKENLHIYGLDLRFLNNVESFCKHILNFYQRLDILIQNAAQTIRRPVAYYKHLIDLENQIIKEPQLKQFDIIDQLSIQVHDNSCELKVNVSDGLKMNNQNLINSSTQSTSQLCVHPEDFLTLNNTELFPQEQYDADHQQIDLRHVNSWILQLDQVNTAELLEVTAINYLSPFILLNKLTPIMKTTTKIHKTSAWVIMVSSMEGQFDRRKSSYHAHTNSAKASLNMITRTAASYYARSNIYINSVDTGWITNENPIPLHKKIKTHRGKFHPPLDEIDGAARILDPIFKMIQSKILEYGFFYKDYKSTNW